MITVEKLEEAYKSNPRYGSALYRLILLYNYNEDEKSGEHISTDRVDELNIYEDLYGNLPTMDVTFHDSGTLFHSGGLKPGWKMYVKLYPKVDKNQQEIPEPYVDAVFTIQYFKFITDPVSKGYIYKVKCVFSAFKYLNNIVKWPVNDTINKLKIKEVTSNSLIPTIASLGGLKGVSKLTSDTNDSMAWLNSNMTCEQFVKHIMSHAWIDNYDAPLYYIDKNGTFYYTSYKTMCDTAVLATYIHSSVANAIIDADKTASTYYRTYEDIMIDDHGYLTNEGGYKNSVYVYNPCLPTELALALEYEPLIVRKAARASTKSYRSYTVDNGDSKRPLFINGESNITPAAGDTTRYISNEMYFNNTYKYYDVAPLHNLNFKKGFFQVFAYLTVNTTTQVNKDGQKEQRVNLGDKIMIDAHTLSNANSIQSGEYIVSGIQHTLTKNSALTIMLSCVRDSITKTKQLLVDK